MSFNQIGDISILNGSSLKPVDEFPYQRSRVSTTVIDISTRLAKSWTAIDRNRSYGSQTWPIKWITVSSKQRVVSILLYGCTTWTLTRHMEKKLDGNYTRMLRAVLNKSCKQHPTKQQLYGHRTPITKTIRIRRTRQSGHCWKSRDELISNVLLLPWRLTGSNGR